MNLKSCENCGVVIDTDRIYFPHNIYMDDGSVDLEKAAWSNEADDFVAKISCPVCQEDILEK